ncbi:L-threonine dehydratase catabolic TdcB [Planctomycetes bacterium Pla163]|uniref:L-threonine dehydratase catabolic TdcB n=1 Tax=Rohdeia mirabilis TaxID=2528008 RepID=A0A518CYX6_9BACT|nr:L-threonine dehydratase catabolic TdcB [Planctomycetes bacterium Pla163]
MTDASAPTHPAQALSAIRAAAQRLEPHIVRTPTVISHSLGAVVGRRVHLKLETLQRTGSFKVRGALNRVLTLSDAERARGIVAASAGNHAQGVALAGALTGCRAVIVMPKDTPVVKVDRTRSHGAEVVLAGVNYEEAYATARTLCDEQGLVMVHPFDDLEVIHGQGTIGLEILADLPDVDTIVVPTGGGGMVAGIALAVKALKPSVRIVGVQAEGANPMTRSFAAGEPVEVERPTTIADGIRVGRVGLNTWPLVRDLVDDMVSVSESEITEAIVRGIEEVKVVTEGAGAAGVAALLAGRIGAGDVVCSLMCGGNIDLNLIARVIERGLTKAGRYHAMRLRTRDVPGRLRAMAEVLAEHGANIVDISHFRAGWRIPVGSVEIEVLIETRGAGEGRAIELELTERGFEPLVTGT